MKNWSAVLLLVCMALVHADADARRLGGGGSFGRQSGNVMQRQATPPAKAQQQDTHRNNTVQERRAASPAQATANAQGTAARRPAMGMLGGLAAALGLTWLAHALGLGEAFGQILLLVLFLIAGAFILRLLFARHAATRPRSGLQRDVPQYRPEKVGNDASARPWEYDNGSGAIADVEIGSALNTGWSIPPDFDVAAFTASAKSTFIAMQKAWDGGDLDTLRNMMTGDMFTTISARLDERQARSSSVPNVTEVLMLEAQVLDIESLPDEYMASVEFSGMISEDPFAGAAPFREVWNMCKPRDDDSNWLVAGVQAMQ